MIYNNYKPINIAQTYYPRYFTYNNVLYNSTNNINNFGITKNTINNSNYNNYVINPQRTIVIQRPIQTIPYNNLIRYNK